MPQNSYPLYLCGLNKTLIHWELSLQKVEYFTSMQLRLLVVVYSHEKDVSRIVSQLGRIVLPLDLADGTVCGLVVFQLDDECRL